MAPNPEYNVLIRSETIIGCSVSNMIVAQNTILPMANMDFVISISTTMGSTSLIPLTLRVKWRKAECFPLELGKGQRCLDDFFQNFY